MSYLHPLSSTLSIAAAAERPWDVGILGAGVAGASLALRLARKGLEVLLLEAQRFPREKVCGGCLNLRALEVIEELGLLSACKLAGGVPIDSFHIRYGRRDVHWKIPPMLSIRRSTLDTLLVQEAIAAGAHFLDRAYATIPPYTTLPPAQRDSSTGLQIQVRRQGDDESPSGNFAQASAEIRARCAVVASGLTRSPLSERKEWPAEIDTRGRIGIQQLISANVLEHHRWCWSSELCLESPSNLRMLIGREGYLGISRTDGEYFDFAAAIHPGALRRRSGISAVIDELLASCDLPGIASIAPGPWASTPYLTRRSLLVATNRTFLLGDSLGYIEPFTGEGMSWGLTGARELATILPAALRSSAFNEPCLMENAEMMWNRWARQQQSKQRSICRWVSRQVRHPVRTTWLLTGLDYLPAIRNMLLKKATQ